ncbi:hypothetical protein [Metaclostridioides mangenotii]|uniref:hypothetical protein n=1 Tax=Metaclostridioides mangenotii TaxID=1540 RepID=UPI00046329B2|nr:hypothetical protein [Clostridioides mangenotii]
MQKLLALDLSVTSTGWCIFEIQKSKKYNYDIISYGKIVTAADDFHTEDERLNFICNEIEKIIKNNEISTVLMEEQYISINKQIGLLLRKLLGASMRTAEYNSCDTIYLQATSVRKNLNIEQRTKVTIDKHGNDKITKVRIDKKDVALYIKKEVIDIGDYSDSGKQKTSDIYDAIALGVAYINILRKEV